MKAQILVKHLLLFLSGLIIAIMVFYSINLIAFHIFRKNFINAKLASETFASVLSAISSSSFNITYKIKVPRECKIIIKDENLTVEFKNENFSSPLIFPSYIKIKEGSVSCEKGFIIIKKVNETVWIE